VAAPLVKICGLTTLADALDCAAAGAHWLGLNFHRPSPRYIDPPAAAAIVAALPAGVEAVGVFVDRDPADLASIARQVGLRLVQLHGDEPPDYLAHPSLSGLSILRAFRLRDPSSVSSLTTYLDRCTTLGHSPHAILVDAYSPSLPGGTGLTVADELLDLLPPLPRLILAGGLTPENVAARVARHHPWMVDVAGGVESAPGRKDLEQVATFVAASRGISRGSAPS